MSKITKHLKELKNNSLFEEPKKTQFEYSSYSSKIKQSDPLYQSTCPEINQTFLIYSSNTRSPSNIELIVPQVTNPLISRASDKIMKEITSFKSNIEKNEKKSFSSDGGRQNEGYKNRPMLNLSRKNLDFSVREFVMSSPTKQNVIMPSIFKDKQRAKRLEENKKYFSVSANKNGMYFPSMKNLSKFDLINKQQPLISKKTSSNDEMFHNTFMREMSAFKEKKMMEWKQL